MALGLDNSLFDSQSNLSARLSDYVSLLEKYTVVVPHIKNEEKFILGAEIYGVRGINKIHTLYKIFKLATRILKNEKFDLITVQDTYYLALLGLILSRKFNLGLEIQVHGWSKTSWWRNLIAIFVLKRAQAVRVVSQRLKTFLEINLSISSRKITVVPIYTDLSEIFDSRAKKNGQFIFLTVGRLVKVKNIFLQIQALKKLILDKQEVELWIVGEGKEKNNLKKLVDKLSLENSVKFFGFKNVEQLKQIYLSADAFVLTSLAEGWGLVVIEATKYGLPVIMTDVGCAGEIIVNNESGFVIKNSLDDLVLSMKKVMSEDVSKLVESAQHKIKLLPNKEETLKLYWENWSKAKL